MCTLPTVFSCFHILDFSWSFDCCRPMSPWTVSISGTNCRNSGQILSVIKNDSETAETTVLSQPKLSVFDDLGVRLNRQRSLFFNTIETKLEFTQEANQIFAFYLLLMHV